MTISERLASIARDRQPVYFTDNSLTWEERLARAYDEASSSLAAALPAGKVLDPASSAIASQQVEYLIGQNSGAYEQSLIDGVDVPDAYGTHLDAEASRDFMLGRFHKASQGLGAYLTGYAREMVSSGEMTADMFERDAEARLRMLSDVVHANRSGSLVSTVTPEQAVAFAKQRLNMIEMPSLGTVFLRTSGVEVDLAPPAGKPGSAGLGAVPLVVAGAVVAVIVGLAAVAGVVYLLGMRQQAYAEARQRAMLACEQATKSGHPKVAEICQNLGDIVGNGSSLSDMLLPKDEINQMIRSAVPWVAGGVGIFLVLSNFGWIVDQLKSGHGNWKNPQPFEAQANRLEFYGRRARR